MALVITPLIIIRLNRPCNKIIFITGLGNITYFQGISCGSNSLKDQYLVLLVNFTVNTIENEYCSYQYRSIGQNLKFMHVTRYRRIFIGKMKWVYKIEQSITV